MSLTQIWYAPAKINLSLRVLGKRADGFHELETLMLPISLQDELQFSLQDQGIGMTCSDPSLPCDATNLVWRAAELFLTRYAISSGVQIHLEKKIPHGAGLGGGSSDAATVLIALREIFSVKTSDEELASIAAEMGSDISFFIYRTAAWCRGRGEIVEPLNLQQRYEGVLVHPGFGVPTPWAYQTYAKSPSRGELGKQTADVVLQNDLEPPVFSKYVWIPTVKKWFQGQPEVFDSMMSGSGSAVFALTKPNQNIEDLKKRFSKEFGESIFATLFHSEILEKK